MVEHVEGMVGVAAVAVAVVDAAVVDATVVGFVAMTVGWRKLDAVDSFLALVLVWVESLGWLKLVDAFLWWIGLMVVVLMVVVVLLREWE